jgi:hypothetical protein
MNYQCETEFNVPTSLLDCNGYKKKMQESTELLKYTFDKKLAPICFMPGIPFQGAQMIGERIPPPQLLDVQTTLRTMPLLEEEKDYFIRDLHRAKPPSMPAKLSNRMVIPECNEILNSKRTKIRRIDFPEFSNRMDRSGQVYVQYMRPGRDTRQEMKDAFLRTEEAKAKNSNIYGVGKFDPRALKPGTNPKCTAADSSNDCMHVYGPDAVRDGTVLDPTLSLSAMAKQGLQGFASGSNGGVLSSGGGVGGYGVNAVETERIAESINPNIPYTQLMQDQLRRNQCNAVFYNYKPPTCN